MKTAKHKHTHTHTQKGKKYNMKHNTAELFIQVNLYWSYVPSVARVTHASNY